MKALLLVLLMAVPAFAGDTRYGASDPAEKPYDPQDSRHRYGADQEGVGNGTAPTDWSSSFVAWWDMDEASGTRDALGSCGADCDLSATTTSPGAGTYFKEGTGSSGWVSSNDENLRCADATCDELDFTSTDVTYGGWFRFTAPTQGGTETFVLENTDASSGYAARIDLNEKWKCTVATGASFTPAVGTTTVSDSVWRFLVCRYTNSGPTLEAMVNINTEATASPTGIAADAGQFELGLAVTDRSIDGDVDMVFVIDDTLTNAELCRIAACGIDGSLCSCNGADYLDTGYFWRLGGNCTLPACNASAP